MRIHQIINDYSLSTGGAQRIVRSLHECLPRKGVESRILGITHHIDDQLNGAQSLGFDSPYHLKVISKISQYLSENVKQGDIIHAHLFPVLIYMSMLKIFGKLKNPLLFTEHNTSNRRRNSVVGKLVDNFTYRGCDKIVAISQGTQDSLLKWKPNIAPKVRVINNGVQLYFTNFIIRPNKGKIKIVSIGRLTAQKNYEVALKAISLIGNYNFEYYIAGDGINLKVLKHLSKKLGIENKVKFMGHVHNIPELLKEADIFFMPSLWEGFGLSAVEAMNAGLPIVASDTPGLAEVLQNKESCALFCDPKSPQSMSEKLEVFIGSHPKRISYGRNGFEHSKKYNQSKMVDEYMKMYNELDSGCENTE